MSEETGKASILQAIVRTIEKISIWSGRLAAGLTLLMVLVGAFNALARWVGRFLGMNLSSNAYIELQWYMFSLIFLLGAANTLRRDGHVRVDVVYNRLSQRRKWMVDLAGTLTLLIPFLLFVLWVTWPMVWNSWAVFETSPDPGGLPRYPLKTVILISFALLSLQALAEVIKRSISLWGGGLETPLGADSEKDNPLVRELL
jgi:TRAP-type mannitol/chloroaromatic compound transport system permease small subunit